jgi:hypothetical protein
VVALLDDDNDDDTQLVGLLSREISPSQGLYLHTINKNPEKTQAIYTSMPRAGFEPMIPALEGEKTVHALDCATTVVGNNTIIISVNSKLFYVVPVPFNPLGSAVQKLLCYLRKNGFVDIISISPGFSVLGLWRNEGLSKRI